MREQASETSFLSGPNAAFIVELYARYAKDPQAVDPGWRAYFASLGDEGAGALADLRGASWAPPKPEIMTNGSAAPSVAKAANGANGAAAALAEAPAAATPGAAGAGAASIEALRAAATDSIRALQLIRAYRVRGHLVADLDPLGLQAHPAPCRTRPEDLWLHRGRLGPADLHRQYAWARDGNPAPDPGPAARHLLRQDRRRVHAYPGPGPEGLDSGAHRIHPQPDRVHRRGQARDPGAADGGRGLRAFPRPANIPAPSASAWTAARPPSRRWSRSSSAAASSASRRSCSAWPHRGRLNVLTNFMGKPFSAIFSEFQGNPANPEDVQGSGDVKYHLGTSADREFDGKQRPSVADRQPLASRSGQSGRPRQGARQAEPARRSPNAARSWRC